MRRPSVFVCLYLLPNMMINVEHAGENPRYDLGDQPVREDVKNGTISELSYRTTSIIDQ